MAYIDKGDGQQVVLRDWDLPLTIEDVFQGMGVDPAQFLKRRPELGKTIERALQDGLPLLEPSVLYRWLPAGSLRHESLALTDQIKLSGPLIAQHLALTDEVVIALCTIGNMLEDYLAQVISDDPLYGMVLDGLGSEAVEVLANTFCNQVELQALKEGLQTSVPLSPGMVGWPVEVGQPQIFKALDEKLIGVKLTESGMMIPRKSLTLVVGIGKELTIKGSPCDYCNLNQTCRYQDHYA